MKTYELRLLSAITLILLFAGCTSPQEQEKVKNPIVEDITADQIKENLAIYLKDYAIIDVREPSEYAGGHIPGSVNKPLETLENGILPDKSRPVITVCRTGIRSLKAARILQAKGYVIKNMAGGMLEWKGDMEK
jgi:rhodanese-related sulfurtransferase